MHANLGMPLHPGRQRGKPFRREITDADESKQCQRQHHEAGLVWRGGVRPGVGPGEMTPRQLPHNVERRKAQKEPPARWSQPAESGTEEAKPGRNDLWFPLEMTSPHPGP